MFETMAWSWPSMGCTHVKECTISHSRVTCLECPCTPEWLIVRKIQCRFFSWQIRYLESVTAQKTKRKKTECISTLSNRFLGSDCTDFLIVMHTRLLAHTLNYPGQQPDSIRRRWRAERWGSRLPLQPKWRCFLGDPALVSKFGLLLDHCFLSQPRKKKRKAAAGFALTLTIHIYNVLFNLKASAPCCLWCVRPLLQAI